MDQDDFIKLIVNDIVSLAKSRQASNLVAAIHGVWGDVGLKLGEIMDKLNKEGRNETTMVEKVEHGG